MRAMTKTQASYCALAKGNAYTDGTLRVDNCVDVRGHQHQDIMGRYLALLFRQV